MNPLSPPVAAPVEKIESPEAPAPLVPDDRVSAPDIAVPAPDPSVTLPVEGPASDFAVSEPPVLPEAPVPERSEMAPPLLFEESPAEMPTADAAA